MKLIRVMSDVTSSEDDVTTTDDDVTATNSDVSDKATQKACQMQNYRPKPGFGSDGPSIQGAPNSP